MVIVLECTTIPDVAPASKVATASDVLDLTLLNEACGSDEDTPALMSELIEIYTHTAQERLGEIQQAVNKNDACAFGAAAHALKGGSLQFGATRVSALCQQLETLGTTGQTIGAHALATALARELNAVFRLLETELQHYGNLIGAPNALPFSGAGVGLV
jgi:HPt (histidine-containing phosphotransfer) domain-containing protein